MEKRKRSTYEAVKRWRHKYPEKARVQRKRYRLRHPEILKEQKIRHYRRRKELEKARRKRLTQWFLDYKSEMRCVLCREGDPYCLDFHHINPEEKEYTISQILRLSFEKTILEIEKCVVICANCHRKIHAYGTPVRGYLKTIDDTQFRLF